jgi:hypothetical protein
MTLAPSEFIRRFLLHILPKGFHRIRHDHRVPSAFRAPKDWFPNQIPSAIPPMAAPTYWTSRVPGLRAEDLSRDPNRTRYLTERASAR